MVLHYDSFWFTLLLATGFVFIAIAVFFTVKIIFAQDIDPNSYCLYKNTYPFNELCYEQQINNIYNQLLNRTQEWNETIPYP